MMWSAGMVWCWRVQTWPRIVPCILAALTCWARCAPPLRCAEATNSRVAWFNILAAMLVCTFCGWQLWYLNKASCAFGA